MKNFFKLPERYSSLRKKLKGIKKRGVSSKTKTLLKQAVVLGSALFLLVGGAGLLWFTTLKIPDLESFDQRILGESTKIFDRTGKILLYDLGQNIRRTVVSLDEMSDNVKKATIAIEDKDFYEHNGFKPTSFIRAALVNITTGEYTQGGSTITQQVIKNSLLTKDKTATRKIKEIFLALKLERVLTKDEILHLYLNESPYGGTIYGIEEASVAFFGKHASELTLPEAAYLAALPQAPSYYSPYGKHRDELDKRKDLVLLKMLENKLIDKVTYEQAKTEHVTFLSGSENGIKAPHFVMFIRQQLEEEFGDRAVAEGGLQVTTTLDYELQKKAEEIVLQYALENDKKFNATNASLVAVDPKTGQILVMVGSRDYFDEHIEGNYNIATAKRQPGSSFKPFVYAKAFEKGYRPATVLFDLKTQFSTRCEPSDLSDVEGCYSPENYDGVFRGPMTLRSALAQSINVPAVKLFYLVGMKDTLDLTKKLGITTLTDPSRYGLSLVLGGGEVTLLDMTGAYSAFAAAGEKRPTTGILKVEDRKGNVMTEWKDESTTVIDKQAALLVTDVLKDNVARTPSYGANSALHFPDREVAVKTGTTNDYRDTWIVGYTPQIAVGAWAGNNDNSPIEKRVAGFVIAPMWHAFMEEALKTMPDETFERPQEVDLSKLPPAIRGVWQGTVVDKDSNGNDITRNDPHSILYWIDKDNPLGGAPRNAWSDPQFAYWEYPIQQWAATQGFIPGASIPGTQTNSGRIVKFITPRDNQSYRSDDIIQASVEVLIDEPIKKVDYFINGTFAGSASNVPYSAALSLQRISGVSRGDNTLKAVVTTGENRQYEAALDFRVRN